MDRFEDTLVSSPTPEFSSSQILPPPKPISPSDPKFSDADLFEDPPVTDQLKGWLAPDRLILVGLILAVVGLIFYSLWPKPVYTLELTPGMIAPPVEQIATTDYSDSVMEPLRPVVNLPLQPMDINHASAATLEQLPGIGPALAQRIVAERQANGLFKTPEEIRRVKGIGKGKLKKMRPYIVVQP